MKWWLMRYIFLAIFILSTLCLQLQLTEAIGRGNNKRRSILQRKSDDNYNDYRHDIVFPVIPSEQKSLTARVISGITRLSKEAVFLMGKIAVGVFVVKTYNKLQHRYGGEEEENNTSTGGSMTNRALEKKLADMQNLLESIFANKSIETILEQQQQLWEELQRLNETQTIQLPVEGGGSEDDPYPVHSVTIKDSIVQLSRELSEMSATCATLQQRLEGLAALEGVDDRIRTAHQKMEDELSAVKQQLQGMEEEFHSALQSHHELFQQRMREVKATLIKIVRDGAQGKLIPSSSRASNMKPKMVKKGKQMHPKRR